MPIFAARPIQPRRPSRLVGIILKWRLTLGGGVTKIAKAWQTALIGCMNAWQGGVRVENPQNLLYVIGMVYSTHAIKSREKYLRAWFQEFLSTLGKLLGFFHAYIGATFIMVYKGSMILKTRGIPYYLQNFGSFHPLLFFQMMEKCLSPEYAKIRVHVIPWFFLNSSRFCPLFFFFFWKLN